MENITFECKSSTDRRTRIRAFMIFLLFALVSGIFYWISTNQAGFKVVAILTVLIYIAAWVIGIYKTPIAYKIVNGELFIVSRFSNVALKIKDINRVKVFDADDRKGLAKIGVEGVKGNIGYYSSVKHSNMMVLTSRDTNWVLINTKINKKYVISPDDLELVNVIKGLINN